MVFIIISVIICVIIYLFFIKEKQVLRNQIIVQSEPAFVVREPAGNDLEKILIDEFGRKYRNVKKMREIPRKTFILGTLNGKYWGELDAKKEQEYEHIKFYDFNIYEVEVTNAIYQFTPFNIQQHARFPRERLPALLPIILQKDGKTYALNIHEPQITNVQFNRKMHQEEGNEVFGTIDADMTGYVLDFTTEEYIDREDIHDEVLLTIEQSKIKNIRTSASTGSVERNGNYSRTQYYYSNYRDTYWGGWVYTSPIGTTGQEGCLSSFIGVSGTVVCVLFILLLSPKLAVLLPFFLLPLLLKLIPTSLLTGIFRILGALLFIGFIFSIISTFNHSSVRNSRKPIVESRPQESNSQSVHIADTVNIKQNPDTLIEHYKSWKDYYGNRYEGKFWVKKSAFINAKNYKNNLSVSENSEASYDKVIYLIKENDKQNLDGIYQLFDSLKNSKALGSKAFAEMIVCFIQDIPYTVVLPEACDPNLYADNFIRNYLSSTDAKCDGHEKFGINTPVEFMATMQGDCDTRTLLLYTMLAHYNYDVVLMSSEFYNHSLIGINLPYEGCSYAYNNQHYTLWETTNSNIKPGILPNEISNLNYWRISLKSK